MSSFIYFIQSGEGPIKIGVTQNITQRLKDLQSGNPSPLRVIGVIRGDVRTERDLHEQFAKTRLRGEWFEASKELVRYIDKKTPKERKEVTPTKRQIAKVIRQAARALTRHKRVTAALFSVCKAHGSRASLYYDGAARALKNHTRGSFSRLITLPSTEIARKMRGAARALEHGLPV